MTETEVLAKTAELHAAQITAFAGSGEPEKAHAYINDLTRQDLAWVVLALTAHVLDLESEAGDLHIKLGALSQRFERAENANIALFAERRRLSDKVAELRAIVNAHASAAPVGKARTA